MTTKNKKETLQSKKGGTHKRLEIKIAFAF